MLMVSEILLSRDILSLVKQRLWNLSLGGDMTVVNVLLKVTYLSTNVKQEPNGALKLKYFTIETQIVLGTLIVGPDLVLESIWIPAEDIQESVSISLKFAS